MTFDFDNLEPWKSIERVNLSDDGEIFVGFGEYLIKSYTELYREIG